MCGFVCIHILKLLFAVNRNIAKAYDILADKMMGIEGVLNEQAWEAKVMSDLIIVFANLVGPGEEESWAELENRRILMETKDYFRQRWRKWKQCEWK